MLPPFCLIPPVPPLHPLQRSSKLLQTGNRSALYKYTVWHSKFILAQYIGIFLHAIMSPQTITRGHLFGKRIQCEPLPPNNKDSVSRHEVCTSCCVQMAFEVLDFALTVERTDTESCISYFVSSTPLPWDQAGQKRLQLREKGRPFDKVF